MQIVTWLLSLQNQEPVHMSPGLFLMCEIVSGNEAWYAYGGGTYVDIIIMDRV